MIYVGTSGFAYKEWKGIFYPEKLPQKEYLSFYSEQFKTTEINNTFYRSPRREMVLAWGEKVPEDFRFTLKMTQRVSHHKRLRDVDEAMGWFLESASVLGDKLGSILVQLPPYFRQDLEVLDDFLGRFAAQAPLALEFRHESWFDEDTYTLLDRHSVPLVAAETDEKEAVRRSTGAFLYLRLRKTSYAQRELNDWADWLKSFQGDAFVYLKHASMAPQLAQELCLALERKEG